MDLYVCSPGREADVVAAWTAARATRAPSTAAKPEGPGLVSIVRAGADAEGGIDPVFARQRLPDARPIEGTSIRALAEAAYAVCQAAVDASDWPWGLHAFVVDADADPPLARRATLVGEALGRLFDERRRRASRRRMDQTVLCALAASARAPVPADTETPLFALVQVVLTTRDAGFASVAPAQRLVRGGTDLSPFAGGRAPVTDDRSAPSRAYRKLEEAFAWLGHAPTADQRVVDLGGSPGGWAWAALKRGAHVVAVDRAPLEAPAAGHPRLDARIGDAFAFAPAERCDWLLCDVIAEPQRSIDLVGRWLDRGGFERAVVTIKFRGRDGYGVLAELDRIFDRHREALALARVKHMAWNQNEVMVLVERRPRAAPTAR